MTHASSLLHAALEAAELGGRIALAKWRAGILTEWKADGSPQWTISACGCGLEVRLRPAGFGETSRRSAPGLTRAEADGSPHWTISATG